MKTIDIKRASLSAIIVWSIGVSAFVGSYSFTLMTNPDEQANWFLTVALIPAIIAGVYFYNKNGIQTNGLRLGGYMFFLTMLLDAFITFPLFIIPAGGNHLSFFTDPGFWMLGFEYVLLVFLANLVYGGRVQQG